MSEIPSAESSVAGLVNTINNISRSNAQLNVAIGKIISPPPNIKIAFNNIILDSKDIYIDAFLLKNYARNAKGNFKAEKITGNTELSSVKGDLRTNSMPKRGGISKPSFVSHSHKINNSYKANAKSPYENKNNSGDYQTSDAVTTDYGLAVGDLVTLLPVNDGQKFIVLAKIIAGDDINKYVNNNGPSAYSG